MDRLRALLLLPFLISASPAAHAQGQASLQMDTPPAEQTLIPGQAHSFTVTLQENTYIQLVVEQRGIDVVVKVLSPDGKSLGEFDSPNGADGPEYVSFVSSTSGNYGIAVTPLDRVGTTSGRYQIKILEMRQATEQEIKAGQGLQIVKAKGVALLLELEETITQIQSPFTRINTQLLVAQLLWESEPKRASTYLTDAANAVKELIASVDASNPDYSQQYAWISNLRFEMTRVLAQRDPEAALSFLYSTVPPPNPYSDRFEQVTQETMMELSIANQVVEKDPNRALQIARKNLKTRLSSNLMSTLSILSRKDPELAAELANEMAGKVLDEKLLKNPEAAHLAISLLNAGIRADRRSAASNYGTPKAGALLTDTNYRDLVQKVLTETLSYSKAPSQGYLPEQDTALNLLRSLQQLSLEVDRVTPGSAAAVEKKFNELSQRAPGPYQYQDVIANNSVDSVLETIKKAPQDEREQLYIQLVNREASSGDAARARQLIKFLRNPHQQRNALRNIDNYEINRALAQGKVAEALRIISSFPTPKERASQLTQIAEQIGPGQKRANAINFLEQARAMLGPSLQAQDQDHMNALLEIARAFARYDSKRSFEIVEPLIDQINEICAAARTLEGFGANNFDNEELNLLSGGNVAQAVKLLTRLLGTLAVTNFDSAKADADRLRLPEVRLHAYLDIAQQSIRGPAR